MTKQEARFLLVREAKIFKEMGLGPNEFKSALLEDPWRLSNYQVEEAYYLIIQDEPEILAHVIPWVWEEMKYYV